MQSPTFSVEIWDNGWQVKSEYTTSSDAFDAASDLAKQELDLQVRVVELVAKSNPVTEKTNYLAYAR